MAQQGDSLYTAQPYDNQSYYEPQPEPAYDYSQQNMGYAYDQQQYEQPGYYQSESRRQSPENSYQGYSVPRKQSPEQEYRVEPQTPKRSSPPKTPTRQLSQEESDKIVQQRQQYRDQLYGSNEGEKGNQNKSLTSKQQSRDNLSEQSEKLSSQSSSPTTPTPKGSSNGKQSPKRTVRSANKGGTEQKAGRNAVGEATGTGRKSDNLQKQSAKGLTNIRGKK